MNNHDKERLNRLQKRLDWLRLRIFKEGKQKHLTYDEAEASALEWAIEIINKYYELHTL